MVHLRLKGLILYLLLVLFAALLGWAQAARAHAAYERSEPAAAAVLPAAPAEVHIWFSEELFRREGANVIEVSGPDGNRVDQGETRIDDDDRTHALVSLRPGLPDGLYTVRWRSLSVEDGHEGSGEFSFTVASGEAETMPQASPTAGPSPAAAPTQASTPAAAPPTAPAAPGTRGLACPGGLLLGGLLLLGMLSGRDRRGMR